MLSFTLDYIFIMFRCCEDVESNYITLFKAIWFTLARSILEYASLIIMWSPIYPKYHVLKEDKENL